MTRSSDQPETSGHGYTEEDLRLLAEAEGARRNGVASDGRGWYRTDEDSDECHEVARAALAALAAAGRLRDTRDDATDFAAVSGYDLGTEEGRRQMEAELRAAGRLLPAASRRQYGAFWCGAPSRLFADLAEARAFVADKQPLYPEHGEIRVRLVGPWVPVSPNPEITDTPTGAVSGNSNPAGAPGAKEGGSGAR